MMTPSTDYSSHKITFSSPEEFDQCLRGLGGPPQPSVEASKPLEVSALHEAVEKDDHLAIQSVLNTEEGRAFIHRLDAEGAPPIHRVRSVEAFELLLGAGASWLQVNAHGTSFVTTLMTPSFLLGDGAMRLRTRLLCRVLGSSSFWKDPDCESNLLALDKDLEQWWPLSLRRQVIEELIKQGRFLKPIKGEGSGEVRLLGSYLLRRVEWGEDVLSWLDRGVINLETRYPFGTLLEYLFLHNQETLKLVEEGFGVVFDWRARFGEGVSEKGARAVMSLESARGSQQKREVIKSYLRWDFGRASAQEKALIMDRIGEVLSQLDSLDDFIPTEPGLSGELTALFDLAELAEPHFDSEVLHRFRVESLQRLSMGSRDLRVVEFLRQSCKANRRLAQAWAEAVQENLFRNRDFFGRSETDDSEIERVFKVLRRCVRGGAQASQASKVFASSQGAQGMAAFLLPLAQRQTSFQGLSRLLKGLKGDEREALMELLLFQPGVFTRMLGIWMDGMDQVGFKWRFGWNGLLPASLRGRFLREFLSKCPYKLDDLPADFLIRLLPAIPKLRKLYDGEGQSEAMGAAPSELSGKIQLIADLFRIPVPSDYRSGFVESLDMAETKVFMAAYGDRIPKGASTYYSRKVSGKEVADVIRKNQSLSSEDRENLATCWFLYMNGHAQEEPFYRKLAAYMEYAPGNWREYDPQNEFRAMFLALLDHCPEAYWVELVEAFLSACSGYFGDRRVDLIHRPLFHKPELARRFFSSLMLLEGVSVQRMGGVRHNYAETFNRLDRSRLFPRGYRSFVGTLPQRLRDAFRQLRVPEPTEELPLLEAEASRAVEVFGRTLLVRDPSGEGPVQAFKFQREGECPRHFASEFTVTQCMANDPGFLSRFARPKALYYLQTLPEKLAKFGLPTPSGKGLLVYHYEADPSYFRYLHDPSVSEESCQTARRAFLVDCGRQIACGSYPELIGLFHNQGTDRGYEPLIDIARIGVAFVRPAGMGRIDRFRSAVGHPNFGEGGRRDVADQAFYEELQGGSDKVSRDVRRCSRRFFEVSALAKAQLSDALVLVERLKRQGRLQWQNPDLVREVAEVLKTGQAYILEGYTGRSFQECLAFADCGLIDWEMTARQVLFWSQNDQDGYLPWVNRGEVPEGLYPEGALVDISQASQAANYHPEKGFQTDGEQDLGPFNGPLAWEGFEKALYVTAMMADGFRRRRSLLSSWESSDDKIQPPRPLSYQMSGMGRFYR